jgi:ribosomal-protein-alanine N-acetyltransferase
MADHYRIRPTTPADLPALVRLEGSAFSDPWSLAMLEEALAARGAVTLVAETGEGVIGSVMGRNGADEGEILTIAIDPASRRQGLGRRLLLAALDQMSAGGARTVWLEVRTSNVAARMMYLGSGFVAAGVRRGYYRRPTEDALILKREITASPSAGQP